MTNFPKLAATTNTHPNVQPHNLHKYMSVTTSISLDRNTSRVVSSYIHLMPLAGVSSSLEADNVEDLHLSRYKEAHETLHPNLITD